MQQNNSKKTLFKFAIPALLILVLITVAGFLFRLGPFAVKPNNSSAVSSAKLLDVDAKTKGAPENKIKLSDKELEKKSQQFNSLLKQTRSAKGAFSGKELEFNWYMGYWDAESKKACGIDTPALPKDAGSAEIPKTLKSIIPAPAKAIDNKKNRIVFEKYGVDGPLAYPQVKDQFIANSDGTIDFNKKINDPELANPSMESLNAMQLKLLDGATLLPIAPNPGEIGNAFIQGHSSNYPQLKSDWNKIFLPFQEKSKVGDTFTIYDCEGRKLIFNVFEAKEIADSADEAWRDYSDKRVVTLQSCILKTRPGGTIHPDARWLTRGELDIDATKKANGVK